MQKTFLHPTRWGRDEGERGGVTVQEEGRQLKWSEEGRSISSQYKSFGYLVETFIVKMKRNMKDERQGGRKGRGGSR